MIDSQMDDMIKEKLTLKQQIDTLEQNLSNQIKEKESLLQAFTIFKNKSKEKESKYMDKEISLEKKIKELDNIVYKVGQSAQTMHMLTKPQVFYDDTHKQVLGYQNLFYLKKAQQIKPTLYDGSVITSQHAASPVIDDEKTLILEEAESSKTPDSNTPVLPSTGLKNSTSARRSQPIGNKKNDRISPTPSSNMKNKAEVQRNCSQLMNFVSKFMGTVRFGNYQIAKIIGYGDYQLGNVTISRVYYIEGLGHNLFSVGQFCDADLEVAFWKNTCFIRNLEGFYLLSGPRDTNLYTISLDDMLKTSLICLLSKASKTKSWLWHHHLSHLNFVTLNKLAKDGLARGIPKLKFKKDHLCSACALGKSKKSSHQPKAEDNNQEKFYLLYMDLCGLICVKSINGKKHRVITFSGNSESRDTLTPNLTMNSSTLSPNIPYTYQWIEKTVRVAEGSSETTIERYMENYKNVSQDIRDQLNAEAEAVHIILTGIDNDIYSTVNACPNACEMWKAIERLKQGIWASIKGMSEIEMSKGCNLSQGKMLLCKQEEAGVQLNAEQADWKDDTDDESDDQELEAHYMYMEQFKRLLQIQLTILDQSLMLSHRISKNSKNFLETSNKALVDKLKGDIEDFKTKNKSLDSLNNHFKEANNELSKTNQLMFKDLKKFQAELDKYHDVNYASKIKLYKTREDKELDKVIALENKVKVLNDIVYKTGQSVQTMNMLNRNCKTSFVKPEFLKKAQRENPRLYDIGCYNDNLALMLAPESDNTIHLAKESRSKLSNLIRPFDYDQLNNLYDLFVP
nr:ribonuclease H-like domain-containing protein [Tanacetum cinerariifolium]